MGFKPPGLQERLEYDEHPVFEPQFERLRAWQELVCLQRLHFHKACLRINRGGHAEYYAFAFALQNPLVIGMTRLVPQRRARHTWWLDLDSELGNRWKWDFVLKPFDCYNTRRGFADVEGDMVAVIPHLVFMNDSRVVSAYDAVALPQFLQDLPPVDKKPTEESEDGGAGDVNSAKGRLQELLANPWLVHHLEGLSQFRKRHGMTPEEVEPKTSNDVNDDEVEGGSGEAEAHASTILEELRAIRFATKEAETGLVFFRVRPLGGHFTEKAYGVGINAYIGEAVGKEARSFQQRYRRGKVGVSFFCSTFGSGENAKKMAAEWCRRMTFFFQHWLNQGKPAVYVFDAHVCECLPPDDEWLRFAGSVTNLRALQRVEEVRALKPLGDGR